VRQWAGHVPPILFCAAVLPHRTCGNRTPIQNCAEQYVEIQDLSALSAACQAAGDQKNLTPFWGSDSAVFMEEVLTWLAK
jgi:hypothetical protein